MRLPASAALVLALLLAGCGGGEPPVRGRLESAGRRPHLLVEGTPREQGRAQGRLLRDLIHAFHEAWHKALLAPEGDLLAPAVQARKRGLLALLGPARQHLPEPARQELAALAEACGLPEPTLLLSELLTDLLRFSDQPSSLVSGRLNSVTHTRAAGLVLDAPLGPLLEEQLIWITRRASPESPAVTTLSWPGSLGGILAARADGLVLMALEQPLEAGRQGLAGVPFDLSLRLAAQDGKDAQDALRRLSRTTAHRVLALDLAAPACWEALLAMTGDDPTQCSATGTAGWQFYVHRDEEGMWLSDFIPFILGNLDNSDPNAGRLRVP